MDSMGHISAVITEIAIIMVSKFMIYKTHNYWPIIEIMAVLTTIANAIYKYCLNDSNCWQESKPKTKVSQ